MAESVDLVSRLRAELVADPSRHTLYITLGYALLARGRVLEAREVSFNALEARPNSSDLAVLCGAVELLHGRPEAAIAHCSRLLSRKDLAPNLVTDATAITSEAMLVLNRDIEAVGVCRGYVTMMQERSRQFEGALIALRGLPGVALRFGAMGTIWPDGHSNFPQVARSRFNYIDFPVSPDVVSSLPNANILNVLSDPDILSSALQTLVKTRQQHRPAIINDPEHVLSVRRDNLSDWISDGDVDIPRCIRIRTLGDDQPLADAVRGPIREAGIAYPVLLRPAGAHSLEPLLVKNEEELDTITSPTRLNAIYVTEWRDLRQADGCWRKTRAFVVKRQVLIEHHYVAPTWCVRGHSARPFMRANVWAQQEAITILKDTRSAAISRLESALTRIPLDIFAVDFFFNPADDRITIFEVSACVNCILTDELSLEGAYVKENVLRIHSAICDAISRNNYTYFYSTT